MDHCLCLLASAPNNTVRSPKGLLHGDKTMIALHRAGAFIAVLSSNVCAPMG